MVVFSRQSTGQKIFHPRLLTLFLFFSFLIMMLAVNTSTPRYLILISIFVALTVISSHYFLSKKRSKNKRFEIITLSQIIPVYSFYLFLLAYWPLNMPTIPWEMKAGLIYGSSNTEILQLIEYIAAFTLFGYMAAEYRGRIEEPPYKSAIMVLIAVIISGGLLEVSRGFHPHYFFSLLQFLFIMIGALYGSVIYFLQLKVVKTVRTIN